MPVKSKGEYGTCSVCELQCRVWEVESDDALLCGVCLRLLIGLAQGDMSQPF